MKAIPCFQISWNLRALIVMFPKRRIGQHYTVAKYSANDHKMIDAFAANGNNGWDLQIGQLFQRHVTEALGAITPGQDKMLQIKQ